MQKKYKALFVSEKYHMLVKRMALTKKVSVISMVHAVVDFYRKNSGGSIKK